MVTDRQEPPITSDLYTFDEEPRTPAVRVATISHTHSCTGAYDQFCMRVSPNSHHHPIKIDTLNRSCIIPHLLVRSMNMHDVTEIESYAVVWMPVQQPSIVRGLSPLDALKIRQTNVPSRIVFSTVTFASTVASDEDVLPLATADSSLDTAAKSDWSVQKTVHHDPRINNNHQVLMSGE